MLWGVPRCVPNSFWYVPLCCNRGVDSWIQIALLPNVACILRQNPDTKNIEYFCDFGTPDGITEVDMTVKRHHGVRHNTRETDFYMVRVRWHYGRSFMRVTCVLRQKPWKYVPNFCCLREAECYWQHRYPSRGTLWGAPRCVPNSLWYVPLCWTINGKNAKI